MSIKNQNQNQILKSAITRRDLLGRVSTGLVGVALADLLGGRLFASAGGSSASDSSSQAFDTKVRPPHFEPRAKAVIQLFMHGGPSQVDLFDPKEALDKYDGQPFPGTIDIQDTSNAGGVLKSPFRFQSHGKCGMQLSELLPNLAQRVDDITLVRSMYTEHLNHEPALWMIHTGETRPGRPSIASWVVYGLGSENENLPAYVVLDDPKGLPIDGIRNWSSGWLPPLFQGTRFRSEGTPVWNLHPGRVLPPSIERARRQLLSEMDTRHRLERAGEPELDARIANYEMAARMQLSATEALDVSAETEATHKLYGLDDPTTASFGRRCLMARRLVERGVRYVQLYLDGQIWDHHDRIKEGLIEACARTDKPSAALVQDLKQRGLLDQTLVLWSGEFGRLPLSQSTNGRDHNNKGFSLWMAGGGVKSGYIHGTTDDFGYAAQTDPIGVRDLHATILHQLGLDHARLVYPRNGLDERLTGVHHPRVVRELLV